MRMLKTVDKLSVNIYSTNEEMGVGAAAAIAEEMRNVAAKKNVIRMMFAAAPSQNTTLSALSDIPDLPWNKVVAFHMDEYIGITPDRPQSFRNYLNSHIFSRHKFREIHLIQGDSDDPDKIIRSYSKLLEEPLDIVILGIGENGHIAFNDPPDAHFDDPQLVRRVKLSEKSRVQQVHDGCFEILEEVPREAITVTIPAFISASSLFCVVPNSRKADAIRKTLQDNVSENCPASILRKHPNAHLYLDKDSAEYIM